MGWTTAEEATMRVQALLTSILVTMCATAVQADSWPAHPLRMVVPVAAGSTTDIIPRAVVEQLSAQLGQPIVVENRAGAGGTIGSAHVARSEPDGYTLLAYGSAHTIAPALYAGLTYDPGARLRRRRAPRHLPGGARGLAVQRLPHRGRAHRGGQAQAGRAHVLIGGRRQRDAPERRAIPRKRRDRGRAHPVQGRAEAMMEVVAGRCDFFFSPLGLAVPQLRAGKVVPLVVNGARRAEVLLDVPTMREAGLADAEYPIWFGLFAPAKTPREVVDRLNRETQKALQSPGLRDRLAQMGLDPMPMSPDEFQVFVRNEVAVNAALVKRAGIKAQ
jgi:tripartite-type tricarboxylate transporter receptor subunit TctC